MRIKGMATVLSIGVILGFISGFIEAIRQIIINKYIFYKMFRLIMFSFQEALNAHVAYFIAGLAALYALLLLIKIKKSAPFLSGFNIRKIALVLIILLLFLNLGIVIDRRINAPRGPNILIILVDALRYDHLGCYGYKRDTSPNIDKLAQEGIIFENAYSHAPWTKPSVASFFTSLYANTHGTINAEDVLPDGALTIAEIFKNRGYSTLSFIGGNVYIGEKFNFRQGFNAFIDIKRIKAAKLTDKFLSLIPKLRKRKFFAYIHYMDTHLPYNKNRHNYLFTEKKEKVFFKLGRSSVQSIRKPDVANKLSIEDKRYLASLYDGQIRYIDKHVERIISALKNNNMLNDTVVIVTADHGEEFWEHNNLEHGHSLYNELIRVPLIMAGNDLKHSKIKTQSGLIDFLPTVLDMANIKKDGYNLEGASLFDNLNGKGGGSEKPIFAMGTLYGDEKYCLIDNNKKLIVNTRDEKGKWPLYGYRNRSVHELYDLSRDPDEQENRKDSEHEEALRLRRDLDNFIEAGPIFKTKKAVIDKGTKERLKSLGYL